MVKFWDVNIDGVLEKYFQLSDVLVYGLWKISVVLTDKKQTTSKTFEVFNYSSPNLDIKLVVPKYLTSNKTTKMLVKIYAKNLNGANIYGKLKLIMISDSQLKREIITDFDGKIGLEIEFKYNVSKLPPWYLPIDASKYELIAEVQDYETGKNEKSEKQTIYRGKMIFEVIGNSYFKPGLPYSGVVIVKNPDNSIAKDKASMITLIFDREFYDMQGRIQVFSNLVTGFLRDGQFKFSFSNPVFPSDSVIFYDKKHKCDLRVMRGSVKYNGDIYEVANNPIAKISYSSTNSFVILNILNPKPPLKGGHLHIQIRSTELMNYVIYQVFGNGKTLSK